MKTFLSWSGGKDSSASIALCYERGIPLDGIIFSEVMFDHSRGISGEDPMHIDFIRSAVPVIEKMGYTVITLHSKNDYLSIFNKRIVRSKNVGFNGKKNGWLLGGMCMANFDILGSTAEPDKIITGDAIIELRSLQDNSIDCCVTSPPYYGLRDYGTDG